MLVLAASVIAHSLLAPHDVLSFDLASGPPVITWVEPASWSWQQGIRPQMVAALSRTDGEAATPADWTVAAIDDDGHGIETPRREPAPSVVVLTVVTALAAGSLSLWRMRRLTLASVCAMAAALLVSSMTWSLDGAGAVMATLGPALVIGLSSMRATRRSAMAATTIVCGGVVMLIAAILAGVPDVSVAALTVGLGAGAVLALIIVETDILPAYRMSVARATDGRPMTRLVGTIEQLVPGRLATRAFASVEANNRLASDLHRDVLPNLQTAISRLEAGDQGGWVTAALRTVATDLRSVMENRRPIILDVEGLLPALEWFADQVQARSGVDIDIDVTRSSVGRPPAAVEVAAFRVSQLAIDNAIAHGHPSRIRLSVDSKPESAIIAVCDDGTGMPPDAEMAALHSGHLGIADMRAYAKAVGAKLAIGPGTPHGTEVVFRWRA
jgi:signal transduction histidine kinase